MSPGDRVRTRRAPAGATTETAVLPPSDAPRPPTAPRERVHHTGAAPARPDPGALAALVADERDLLARRHRLAAELAQLQWDLGGLAYEMAIRDHFRLDVLVRRAARLQEVDAELAEVERLLRLDEAAASGECSSCGALHSRGAVFCWQCGGQLMARPGDEATPGARAARGADVA